jgi:Flp pilus assembly protein CpaB
MPKLRANRIFVFAAAAAVAGLIAAIPASAAEQKSTRNEAEWVGYDAAAKTVTLKIKKLGLGPNADKLKVGQESVFNVQPEGSVLSRTSVAVNGKKGALTDIKPGKTVLIYWVPDPKDAKARFARKIDVILSEQELDERYGEAE